MEMFTIQISDPSCGWVNIRNVIDALGGGGNLRDQMEEVQRSFPDRRVRAVDKKGRFVGAP